MSTTMEIVSVDPALARRWLKSNERNRHLRMRAVENYARDMLGGRWAQTGEAIKFSNGRLLDGQHRLAAVIASGMTIDFLIISGLDDSSQELMDSGVKRSSGDALALRGRKFTAAISAAARLCLREPVIGYVETKIATPTHSEIVAFVEAHPEIDRAAEVAMSYYPAIDIAPSVLIVAFMKLSAIDYEAAVGFYHALARLDFAGEGDPRAALVKRIVSSRRNSETLKQMTALAMLLRTWNFWRTDKKILKLPTEARYPSRLV